MYVALVSLFATAIDLFSRQIRLQGKSVFSENSFNLCIRIAVVANWTLSLVMLLISVVDLFVKQELLTVICIIFFAQLICNFVYTTVVLHIASLKRRRLVQNSLLFFLEEHQNDTGSDDTALIDQFCREYPDANKKESMRALKRLKSSQTK